MISKTAIIYPNVILGDGVVIEEYCIIGCLPKGKTNEEVETFIGDNAHIRSHTVIYAGNIIGKNFQTGHKTNIREYNTIGDDVSIGTLSVVEHHVEISRGVRVHTQAFIPEYSVLKENAWVGPNVVLTNALYPRSPKVKENLKGPTLEENAKIGANSTILPGINVGKNSLIGAGSVVTKDIPENVVAVGSPAEVKKSLYELPYE